MNHADQPKSPEELNREVREIWNGNAGFWDARMGEGNDFHKILIEPTQQRLLGLRPGEEVLDIACGNGQFTRHMARLGARVTAFDFAEQFIALAKARTAAMPELAGRIDYQVLDATDRPALLTLGERRFDAAVCTMAFMDMARLEPLLEALTRLLKPQGRFVFSVLHPCFNGWGSRLVTEREETTDGELRTEYAVKITRYSQPTVTKGLGMLGQPAPHYYFNRPLSLLLNTCFQAGLVLDALEEPVFGAAAAPESAWAMTYQAIPAALVARLRVAN